MAILVMGLVVFLGVHSVRIVAPGWRDRMVARFGEGPFKGAYSIASAVGFALIIWGFSRAAADTGMLYTPPSWLRPVTAALMLPALILAVSSVLPTGYLKRAVRHPLLIGTALWALAHLFVNGEIATLVLFGAFLAWAILDLVAQPRRAGAERPPASPVYDIAAVVVGIVLYGALVWRLHAWAFGVAPTA